AALTDRHALAGWPLTPNLLNTLTASPGNLRGWRPVPYPRSGRTECPDLRGFRTALSPIRFHAERRLCAHMSLRADHVQFAFRVTRAEFQSLTDDQMLGRTALERRFARPAPSVSSGARQASRACVMAGGPLGDGQARVRLPVADHP